MCNTRIGEDLHVTQLIEKNERNKLRWFGEDG